MTTEDADGIDWAIEIGKTAPKYFNMGITYGSDGEYENSHDVLHPIAAPSALGPPMTDTAPPMTVAAVTSADVIAFARSCIGKYTDGPDVPKLARAIAARFPDIPGFAAYCALAKDDTQWCGIFIAFVLAHFGIRPPFNEKVDVESFMYVDGWLPWGESVPIGQQQPGDIAVFVGSSLHHITFIDSGGYYVGGNQGDAVTRTHFSATPKSIRRIPGGASMPADAAHYEIQSGMTGAAVIELQTLLGITADGDFGPETDAAVRSYQTSHGLDADGVVGDATWAALLAGKPAVVTGEATVATGTPMAIPADLAAKIVALAGSSPLANYSWQGRGNAPVGYIKGMALAFAKSCLDLKAGAASAMAMTVPLGSVNTDALAWYGVSQSDRPGTLRNLFTLLIGLGMRESSGNCYEGRDASASNFTADTAEAGLFQQSWNSHVASAELPKLLSSWAADPSSGFLSIFREGLSGSKSPDEGSGAGVQFQMLCKTKPCFAVECAAVGLRTIRKHWGPINRREAEIRPECDALLRAVQDMVDRQMIAPTIPQPTIPQPAPTYEPPMTDTNPNPEAPMTLNVDRFVQAAATLENAINLLVTQMQAVKALPAPSGAPIPDPSPMKAAPATPAVAIAAPVAAPTARTGLGAGILGLLINGILASTGVMGTPVGEAATTTGQIVPMVLTALTALGANGNIAGLLKTAASIFGALGNLHVTTAAPK